MGWLGWEAETGTQEGERRKIISSFPLTFSGCEKKIFAYSYRRRIVLNETRSVSKKVNKSANLKPIPKEH
jgi:hypothetical protein